MKVRVNKDERYPDYSIIDSDQTWATEVDLTDEQIAQVRAAGTAYNEAQKILRDAVAKAQLS